MYKKLILLLVALGIANPVAFATNKDSSCTAKQFRPIMKRMNEVTDCWNNGNMNCIINKFYAKRFIYVGSGIIRSKAQLRQHYRSAFQEKKKASLGKVKFDFIHCHYFNANNILTLQKYILTTPQGVQQGYDVLIWKKENSQFYIKMDFPKAINAKL